MKLNKNSQIQEVGVTVEMPQRWVCLLKSDASDVDNLYGRRKGNILTSTQLSGTPIHGYMLMKC